MTTKDQERQAIEKIRKIVEGLGENSYVGFAMEGVLELAEDNIPKKAQQKKGRYYTALYKQAGNSIAVPIFESIFRKIILNEVREKEEQK